MTTAAQVQDSSNSATSTIPLFGRRYNIVIQGVPGGDITVASDTFEPEQLRVTFDVYQAAYQVFWWAEVDIYNLSEETNSAIMAAVAAPNSQAITVKIDAGYQALSAGYGTIFNGPIFQTLFERENTVDTKLTMHCILGLGPLARNGINNTFAAGLTQAQLFNEIAKVAFSTIPVSKVSPSVKADNKLSRGKTVFGNPSRYFSQIANNSNMQWWLDKQGLNMTGVNDTDIPSSPSLTFSPPSLPLQNSIGASFPPGNGVIVDTPQQIPFGVRFKALLDARVQVTNPYLCVKIDNTLIRKMKAFIDPSGNQWAQITVLDKDLIFIVNGIRFIGDTRGNPWYVEVNALTRSISKTTLMLNPNYNTNNG